MISAGRKRTQVPSGSYGFQGPSSFPSQAGVTSSVSVKEETVYASADVTSTNLMVECIRLSGGKNTVERCEELWYSDSSSVVGDVSSAPFRDGDVNKGPEMGDGIYPNDYTFELMSKIWVENRCKDIAVRSQSLFDRSIKHIYIYFFDVFFVFSFFRFFVFCFFCFSFYHHSNSI
jgi:hypothetical protein